MAETKLLNISAPDYHLLTDFLRLSAKLDAGVSEVQQHLLCSLTLALHRTSRGS